MIKPPNNGPRARPIDDADKVKPGYLPILESGDRSLT